MGETIDTILIGGGVACLIAAIIGGGLKGFGVELPALESMGRRVALGVLGAGLLAASYFSGGYLSRIGYQEPAPAVAEAAAVEPASAEAPAADAATEAATTPEVAATEAPADAAPADDPAAAQ